MKTLIKALTLTFFFGMIGLFVAYRGGLFSNESPVPMSPNGSNINSNQSVNQQADDPVINYDSIRHYDSTLRNAMPSTKSIRMHDRPVMMYFYTDSMGVRHYVSRETVYGRSKYGSEIAPEEDREEKVHPFSSDDDND